MSKRNTLIMFRVDTRGDDNLRALDRCLILADAHLERGGRVVFALGHDQRSARSLVVARGLDTITITAAGQRSIKVFRVEVRLDPGG